MKATTCQMSNVSCAMLNVVVKASDQTTKFLVGERLRHIVIGSVGSWTSSLDIAEQTFDHLTIVAVRRENPSPGALRRLIHSHPPIHLRGRRGVYALQPVRRCARSPRSSSDCHESAHVGKHRASAA